MTSSDPAEQTAPSDQATSDPSDHHDVEADTGAVTNKESDADAGVADPNDERRRLIDEAYERVPAIGSGRRWYDFPYRLLTWLSTGSRRKLFPRAALERFNLWVNYLIPFNEHERNKLPGNFKDRWNPAVPEDEHVVVPNLWIVELFPPSELAGLEAAIDRSNWDRRRRVLLDRESSKEMLTRSRAGSGWSWWRLAEIATLDSKVWFPDGSREKLPQDIDGIELRAIQIGQGLTAVAARFWIAEGAASRLDEVWHTRHEPQLVKGSGRPRAESREWASYRLTQEARRSLHDEARSWMTRRLPGYFAAAAEPQPLIDLLLMDQFDPSGEVEPSRDQDAAFRALGLTEYGFIHRASAEMPKLALVPTRVSSTPAIGTDRTLALWGRTEAAADAAGDHLAGYGSDQARAIASRYSDEITSFLLEVAVSGFVSVAEARFADLRDYARVRHGRFDASAVASLREHLLTLSIDISSTYRDLQDYWARPRQMEDRAEFVIDRAPWVRARDEAEGGKWSFAPVRLNESMQEAQTKDFERLVQSDRDYREILSTVTGLSASADASRLSRRALWVAGASLLVAVVTVLVADFGRDSIWQKIVEWVSSFPW